MVRSLLGGYPRVTVFSPTRVVFDRKDEHNRVIAALRRTGIATLLPRSGGPGVIGVDGNEYPAPTQERVREIFAHNSELIEEKTRQGFTRLLYTPFAVSVSQLVENVSATILKHTAAGTIMRTKPDPDDDDIPAVVRTGKPVWVWDKAGQSMDGPGLCYFPNDYSDRLSRCLTRQDVLLDMRLCAVPGWSVSLVEPTPVMPRPGHGRTIGGRKQLEAGLAPRDYLQALNGTEYHGETGWTPEDFLTHFVTRLDAANQVSHDRSDGNALWLLGSYIPSAGPGLDRLVPVGYWARVRGRIELTAHRAGNRLAGWVARTIVRLSA